MNENTNKNEEISVNSMSVEECEIALGELEAELAAFSPEEKLPSLKEYFDARMNENDDPLLIEAARIAASKGEVGTSIIQRRLNVGYGRAAKLLDRLEELEVIAPPNGTSPRRVLVSFSDVTVEESVLVTDSVYENEVDLKKLDGEKANDGDGVVFAFTLNQLSEEPSVSERESEQEQSNDNASAVAYVDDNELFVAAARLVVEEGVVSTSFLQRRLKIGYGRAAEIVDRLEKLSIVSPVDGNHARRVLVSSQKLDRILRDLER